MGAVFAAAIKSISCQSDQKHDTGDLKPKVLTNPKLTVAANPTKDHRMGMTESHTTHRPRASSNMPIVNMVVGHGAMPNIGLAIIPCPAHTPRIR